MKTFTRTDAIVQSVGQQFKKYVTIEKFHTEDGLEHEFTTLYREGDRAGAVIAITPDKRVVVTYQFRPGPERWMYDIPGGGIFKNEDPQIGVLRELKEETGYVPGRVERLGESCRDAYSNAAWHYYLATNCTLSPDGQSLDKVELDQGAEVRLISIAEFLDHAKHDRMTDPAAVLMAYDKLKEIAANDESN